MTGDPLDRLVALVAPESRATVPAELGVVVAALRARFGPAVAAVLYYGSCLRLGTLDGVIDVYVLIDDVAPAPLRRRAMGGAILALACRLLPPNVYHLSVDGPRTLAVKAAVMSLAGFARGLEVTAFVPALWARFAQPAVAVYARDEAIAASLDRLRARAVATAAWHGAHLAPARAEPLEPWRRVFRATYGCELRAEAVDRADAVVEAAALRYAELTRPALAAAGIAWTEGTGALELAVGAGARRRARLAWALRRPAGKLLSLLRLAKAAFTFEGGADYLAWKIERHAGVRPALSPWQRRHPLLALPLLAWRLWRQGVVR